MAEDREILPESHFEEHIKELKSRTIRCLLVFLTFCCIGLYFTEEAYDFLAEPLLKAITTQEHQHKLIFTGLTEGFMTHMKLGFFLGVGLSFPYIIFQIYGFLSPGLYKHERKMILPFVVASVCLFFTGIALAYFFVAPVACKFFVSFEGVAKYNNADVPIILEARISEYLSTIIQLLLSFGIVFQLPIFMVLLVKLGILKVETLVKYRRHAIVVNFIAAAILTPPDVISQVMLAMPMVLLYELSIFLVKKLV